MKIIVIHDGKVTEGEPSAYVAENYVDILKELEVDVHFIDLQRKQPQMHALNMLLEESHALIFVQSCPWMGLSHTAKEFFNTCHEFHDQLFKDKKALLITMAKDMQSILEGEYMLTKMFASMGGYLPERSSAMVAEGIPVDKSQPWFICLEKKLEEFYRQLRSNRPFPNVNTVEQTTSVKAKVEENVSNELSTDTNQWEESIISETRVQGQTQDNESWQGLQPPTYNQSNDNEVNAMEIQAPTYNDQIVTDTFNSVQPMNNDYNKPQLEQQTSYPYASATRAYSQFNKPQQEQDQSPIHEEPVNKQESMDKDDQDIFEITKLFQQKLKQAEQQLDTADIEMRLTKRYQPRNLNNVVNMLFRISGVMDKNFVLSLTPTGCYLLAESGVESQVSIEMDDKSFQQLLEDKMSLQNAFVLGKATVKGQMSTLSIFDDCFGA